MRAFQLFLFQYCCDYMGSFAITLEFENWLFHFCKRGNWDFNRDCINLQIALESVAFLTVLSLPVHEHGCLLYLGLLEFHSVMFCSFHTVCKTFPSLIIFIHRYFIILKAIVNEIVFLISFLDCSLLVYVCIYLFLAALCLRCCTQTFSSCSEQGLFFVAVHGLLIAVASLVAEHRLQARRLQQLWLAGSRAQAQQLWRTGLVAPRHVGSFWTRARTLCTLHWQADS